MEQNLNFNLVSGMTGNLYATSPSTGLTATSQTTTTPMTADSASLSSYPAYQPNTQTEEKPGLMDRFTKWLAKVTFEPLMNLFFSIFRPS